MDNTDFGDWGKDNGSGGRNNDDERATGHPPPNQNGAIGPRNPVSAPDSNNTWGNNEPSNGPNNHSVGYQRRNVDNNDWDRSNNTNPGMLYFLLFYEFVSKKKINTIYTVGQNLSQFIFFDFFRYQLYYYKGFNFVFKDHLGIVLREVMIL